jgi:serine/threonine protein kinase
MFSFMRIFIGSIFIFGSLHATITENNKAKIENYITGKRYHKLTMLIEHLIKSSKANISLLESLPQVQGEERLYRAIRATSKYLKIKGSLEFSREEFFRTAFFIERNKQKLLSKEALYSKKKTGLPIDLEINKHNNLVFMVLNGWKSAYLGKGGAKIVYKAVAYGSKGPLIVARAVQRRSMNKELKFTKKLQGKSGVVKTLAVKIRKIHGKRSYILYSKLYNLGSLKSAFVEKRRFSIKHKLQIAKGALKGLETLHHNGIVHRDIAAQNIFLNVVKDRHGKKNFQAVIADFGWANFAKKNSGERAQANTKNAAPEGRCFKMLQGKHYYKTDVFALGLVLYNLAYGEKAHWKEIGFCDPNQYKNYLKQVISKKQQDIRKHPKKAQNKFKALVLKMLDPNAHKRPSAKWVRHQVEALLNHMQ